MAAESASDGIYHGCECQTDEWRMTQMTAMMMDD